jgi:hypothetical protein
MNIVGNPEPKANIQRRSKTNVVGLDLLRRVANSVADDAEHFVLVDRLLEKGDGAGRQGFFPELGRFAAGDEDDRRLANFIDATKPIENQKSIPRNSPSSRNVGGEMDIEDDEIGALTADTTDGSGAIHRRADFVTGGLEFDGNRLEHHNIVVGDKDFRDVRPERVVGGFRS